MTKKVEEDKSFRSQKTQQNAQGNSRSVSKKQNPMSLYVANSTPKVTKTQTAQAPKTGGSYYISTVSKGYKSELMDKIQNLDLEIQNLEKEKSAKLQHLESQNNK